MKFSDGKPYKVVALCMAKFNGNEQKEFLDEFYKTCDERNIRIHVFSTMTDFYFDDITNQGEEQIFELMEPEKYDAVIIFTSSFKRIDIAERISKRAIKAGVPCLSLIVHLANCINITIDFGDSFEEVVRHIVEYHKPRHINFIAGFKGNDFSEERLNVFKKVLRENNIPIEEDRIGYGDFWEAPTETVMKQFLASGKPIDAIICANDIMAMEACRQLQRVGLRIPDDVIVSGFDGIDLEKYHYPRLATCQQDQRKFSDKIGEIIDDLVEGIPVENEYKIGCLFRTGQSCGCKKIKYDFETLENMGTRYFNVYRRNLINEAHIEALYEKIPTLIAAEKMAEIWGTLLYLHKSYIGDDFLLALNNDLVSDDSEIWPTVRPHGLFEPHHYYTDRMVTAFERFDDVFSSGGSISRSDLVGDYGKYADKKEVLLFLPFHIQESTAGYVVQAFYPKEFDYFMLYAYVMNLRHIIEMHKYRIDQINLYSTDQLTKLLNRKGFYRHMESRINNAIKNQKQLCVISVDMNWLKQINDTYGHKEGDFALAKIGSILEYSVGDAGVCTRFGGDEFAIAFVSDNATERAEEIISCIESKLKDFNSEKRKPYPLSVSKGYFVHIPEEKNYHLERFIVEADRKMYQDKAEFKKNHSWEGMQA